MKHFADDILICILFSEKVWILIKISLMFLPKGPIDNMFALDQMIAWCRPGDKPLSKTMLVRLVQHTSRVSSQKGPTRHAYAWQIGPFWQDTLKLCDTQPQLVTCKKGMSSSSIMKDYIYLQNMGFDEGWKIQIYFYAISGKCRITYVDSLAPGDVVVISKV